MKKKLTMIFLMMVLAMAFAMTAYGADAVNSLRIELDISPSPGDSLPELHHGYTGDSGCEVMIPSNDRYDITSAKWSSNVDEVTLGGSYTIKIQLETLNDYRFNSSYSSSKVHVSGGTFVSAQRSSRDRLVVTVKTKPAKGTFEEPDDAYWETTRQSSSRLGIAKWSRVSGAAYDVYLYRGSKQVHRVNDHKGTSYNFYPYMTTKGDYTFRVRAVAGDDETSKYASSSEWTYSDEVYVDEDHVSDGSGKEYAGNTSHAQIPETNQVGWVQNGGRWFYRYPDGTFLTDSWASIGGIWYLFDGVGAMQTGWQMRNGTWYYMDGSGAMKTGWQLVNGAWYYMFDSGAMATGWLRLGDKHYYLSSSGAMVSGWQSIDNQMYYFYPDGSMAAGTYVDGFYVGPDGVWRRP